MIKDTLEYRLIRAHYGDRVAKRSQVPLINHINEGLIVLDAINAMDNAKMAFCIHPLVQADDDLRQNYLKVFASCDSLSIMFAMEYRSVANEFLSDKMDDIDVGDSYYGIPTVAKTVRLSPLTEVNDMLIADKVQNYKDFVTYHQKTHPRSSELDDYFNIWMEALGVTDKMYVDFCKLIDASKV